ncbi:hypothetical protein Y032_0027g1625 [Ancylostoma ceylanicum]|uniref:Uncharacterized protein n=1 Tax=Ancylostoma ceylanicum TaxID=53326 RepID=A0A016UUJ3_9BILA|nr:hypothetical protein Y032_0027g1625 [Ancylostoma ceylanicum]
MFLSRMYGLSKSFHSLLFRKPPDPPVIVIRDRRSNASGNAADMWQNLRFSLPPLKRVHLVHHNFKTRPVATTITLILSSIRE